MKITIAKICNLIFLAFINFVVENTIFFDNKSASTPEKLTFSTHINIRLCLWDLKLQSNGIYWIFFGFFATLLNTLLEIALKKRLFSENRSVHRLDIFLESFHVWNYCF